MSSLAVTVENSFDEALLNIEKLHSDKYVIDMTSEGQTHEVTATAHWSNKEDFPVSNSSLELTSDNERTVLGVSRKLPQTMFLS